MDGLEASADFALAHRDLPALAYTHFQPAQPTTVGKRAALWGADLLLDLEASPRRAIEPAVSGRQGRDRHAGLLPVASSTETRRRSRSSTARSRPGRASRSAPVVSGQTYSRKQDDLVVHALSGLAQSAHKIGDGPAPAPARRGARGALRDLAGRLLRHALQAQPDARRAHLRARAARHRALARHGDDRRDAVARAQARRLRQQAHRRARGVPRRRRDPGAARERLRGPRRAPRGLAGAGSRPRCRSSRPRTS